MEQIKEQYTFESDKVAINVKIYTNDKDFVPIYEPSIKNISKTTEIILDRIRDELIQKASIGVIDVTDSNRTHLIEEKLKDKIWFLLKKYFPSTDANTMEVLYSYFIRMSLGMGNVEILMDDPNLEEVVINSAKEPVWIYHKRHGWLKTTVELKDDEQIKHYARTIGRRVDRQITLLNPLMDAHLDGGNRVNATLTPISTAGTTMTIRKFAAKPWTITDFIKTNTISKDAAAFVWMCMQYELSGLVAGGTASGKTSMLNALASFIPPNQRILTIEDTREMQLPEFLHWVPMNTRQPNPEGKGAVSMLDLLINSLRMRPDRIFVGEIRKHAEAEVLFEAIHTGHSVYATVHANNISETITRLTSPPIAVPIEMIPALSFVIVQYRNRRTGLRRTFQIAEIMPDGRPSIIKQYDASKDAMDNIVESSTIIKNLELFAGLNEEQIRKDLQEKEKILDWLVHHDINTVNEVGLALAKYYTDKDDFMKLVNANKPLNATNETIKKEKKQQSHIDKKEKITEIVKNKIKERLKKGSKNLMSTRTHTKKKKHNDKPKNQSRKKVLKKKKPIIKQAKKKKSKKKR